VPETRTHWRALVFLVVLTGCIVSSAIYLGIAYSRAHRSAPPAGVRVVTGASLDASAGPQLLFRNAIPDKTFGELAVA
jgi:hypothetical protein